MKNFALALVAATAISGAQAEIGTGVYLGANAAMNSFDARTSLTDLTDNSTQLFDGGRTRPGVGMYVGYGMVSGCLYYAGEIGYQFANGHFGFASTDPVVSGKFKRRNEFNFALRIGYKLTPATIGYLRLGGNWSKYKIHTNIALLSGSKSKISFAPGFGAETAFNRNWVARMEWTYDFGNSFARQSAGVAAISFHRVRSQSAKVGIAYKF